ncbi:6-phosphofructokinase [Alicyclobacillus mengziensis]|uniref:6-phosphofructokinase n=1 Tax=Alicyclobacillus mengziensis TaxID=2931921 RepID=A0A9X7W287_9BACL|nr:6-phosphofructokinase [Alicyclobacillus mengziensis]QSO49299.1 6-phosphofructokinase [Alicyclobacillus mengziensis]
MKVAIGQFGAPTTVFNSSLYGVLEGLQDKAEVYGVIGGVSGLVSGQMALLKDISQLSWLLETPSAALGAGRYSKNQEVVEETVRQLIKAGIDAFILLGGNGTMGLGAAVSKAARELRYPLNVVGVPKTIDNDIVGIDHAPGFPSAARFVLQAVRDLQIDLEAMVGFEQVRVVEVMGRRCGWLAAASALLPHIGSPGTAVETPAVGERVDGNKADGNKVSWKTVGTHDVSPPPIICMPEQPLDLAALLKKIESRVVDHQNALVVVSEGVLDVHGEPVVQAGQPGSGTAGRNSSSVMLGGIGSVIAAHVREELGFGARYENLGLLQRCWNDCSLASDRRRARQLGQMGARVVLDGQGGVMVGLVRDQVDKDEVADGLEGTLKDGWRDGLSETMVPLDALAGQERRMTEAELRLDVDFVRWLGPLVEMEKMTRYPRLRPRRQSLVSRMVPADETEE